MTTAAADRSALYECRVLHHRFEPRVHRFAYRLFYLALDLDELPALHRRLRLFSVNRANVFSIRERDYLPLGETVHNQSDQTDRSDRTDPAPGSTLTLKQRVAAFCTRHGVELPADARITLITLPRVFGYQFNPVSFYFCRGADGTPLAAIAEVTNTFREMKPYFIPLAGAAGAGPFHLRAPKHFYVSPFSDVDVAFDFTLHAPGQSLAIRIDDFTGERRTLHSALTGRRAPLTDGRLAAFTLKYPLLTLRVIALIHWHALRLWLKRVPFFAKAARAADQRDLFRPHPSIARSTLS